MRSAAMILSCTALMVLATEVVAQTNPNQLVAQRKGAMNLQGKYFGPLLGMARGRIPFDQRLAERNADYLAVLAEMPWDDFQASTAGNPNTRAKDDLYKESAKAKSTIETFQADIKKLQAAARAGNESALKPAAFAVARTCNSCHEAFATFEYRFPTQ